MLANLIRLALLARPANRLPASKVFRMFANAAGKPDTAESSRKVPQSDSQDEDQENMASESDQYYDNRCQTIKKMISEAKQDPTRSPYPHKWHSSHSVEEIITTFKEKCSEKGHYLSQSVTTAGRVTSLRKAGSNLFFFDLKSGGGQIQLICNSQQFSDKNHFERIDDLIRRGDIIGIKGEPGLSKRGEFSLNISELQLLSPCLYMMPQERTGIKDLEVRFRQRYLDLLINKGVREKFIIRQKVFAFLRRYLDSRGFLEVETPTLSVQAGGATARPFKTYHNDLKMDLTMRVAPELYLKNLIIGGFEKVYEIGKNFRNEGIDHNHNPEFTACEFYWAFADYNDVMNLTEDLLSSMVQEICGSKKIMIKRRHEEKEVEIDFSSPWPRIAIMEELEKVTKRKFPEDLSTEEANHFLDSLCQELGVGCSAPRTTARLIDKLVGTYIEPRCTNPTFLTDHPQIMSPLAKPHRSKVGQTERFELFINEFEIVNAYTELNDPFLQKSTFEAQMEDKVKGDEEAQPYDADFIKALEHGLPPTAGFGIGLDRLVMLLTNSETIQEIILFPAMKPRETAQTQSGANNSGSYH